MYSSIICPICGRDTDPGNYCQRCGAIQNNANRYNYPIQAQTPNASGYPMLPSQISPYPSMQFNYMASSAQPAPPPTVHKMRMDSLYYGMQSNYRLMV